MVSLWDLIFAAIMTEPFAKKRAAPRNLFPRVLVLAQNPKKQLANAPDPSEVDADFCCCALNSTDVTPMFSGIDMLREHIKITGVHYDAIEYERVE